MESSIAKANFECFCIICFLSILLVASVGHMTRTLCSNWLSARAKCTHLTRSGSLALILYKEKICMERTYKLCNIWKMSAIKMKRAEEHSQNKENTSVCREFICCKHSWLSYWSGSWNKQGTLDSEKCEKILLHNKSLIDQACSVKIAG